MSSVLNMKKFVFFLEVWQVDIQVWQVDIQAGTPRQAAGASSGPDEKQLASVGPQDHGELRTKFPQNPSSNLSRQQVPTGDSCREKSQHLPAQEV